MDGSGQHLSEKQSPPSVCGSFENKLLSKSQAPRRTSHALYPVAEREALVWEPGIPDYRFRRRQHSPREVQKTLAPVNHLTAVMRGASFELDATTPTSNCPPFNILYVRARRGP